MSHDENMKGLEDFSFPGQCDIYPVQHRVNLFGHPEKIESILLIFLFWSEGDRERG